MLDWTPDIRILEGIPLLRKLTLPSGIQIKIEVQLDHYLLHLLTFAEVTLKTPWRPGSPRCTSWSLNVRPLPFTTKLLAGCIVHPHHNKGRVHSTIICLVMPLISPLLTYKHVQHLPQLRNYGCINASAYGVEKNICHGMTIPASIKCVKLQWKEEREWKHANVQMFALKNR